MTMTFLPSSPPRDVSSSFSVPSTMPCWSVVMLTTKASVASVAASMAKIGMSASLAAVTIESDRSLVGVAVEDRVGTWPIALST